VATLGGEGFIHAGYDISRPAGVRTTSRAMPADFGLEIHPNPFNAATRVRFHCGAPGFARIVLFSVAGRKVGFCTRGGHGRGITT